MFNNTRVKKAMMEERAELMSFMLLLLEKYQSEVDAKKKEFYMEHIKYYGELSARIKDELDRKDYSRWGWVERDYELFKRLGIIKE